MTTRPSRIMTTRPSRLMTTWPSRLMTPRPSRLHLGPGHSTSDHNAARAAPLCQLWTCQTRAPKSQALGVPSRRLVETAAGAYAPTPSQRARTPPARASTSRSAPSPARASTSRSAPSPARASTSRSAPSQAPRGTQRDEPAQVGRVHPKPPRCSPFGDAKGVQTP